MTTEAIEAPQGRSPWMAGYRSVLRRRDIRRLLAALLISSTGDWAYNVALLAFLFDRTHSLAWVGAASLGRFIPSVLASPYAGVLAERTERIRMMVSSDLLSALLQGGLVVVAVTKGPPVLAIVLAALASVSGSVYQPATAATIPSLVTEDDLAAANALSAAIDQLVSLLGPAIGALLLVAASPAAVFGVDGVSFVLSALIVVTIRTRSHPVDVTEGGTAGILGQMMVGARTIASLPAARLLVAYCALVSFVYGTDTVLFVAVSVHKLGTGTHGFGYLLGGLGVGGVVMAAAVDRLAGLSRLALIILLGALGYTLPTALLIVIHSPALAFVVEVFRGGATLVVDVLAITALQRAVAPDLIARVFGIFFAFMIGAISLGALITPAITSGFGVNAALWTMSLGPAVIALLGFPALLGIDRQTAARARELEPKVALLETLGLFRGARRPILERLAGSAKPATFTPGTRIITEGEAADALYILVEGQVQVSARGEVSGEERPIRIMQAPAYFGEIGVLERIPRTASVTAITPCRCELIDGELLLDALTASPASSSLMESARSRLAVTHPSRQLKFAEADQSPPPAADGQ